MANKPNWPKWCCQQCGLPIGYLGRFFEWLFGLSHQCCWPHVYQELPRGHIPRCVSCGKRKPLWEHEFDEYEKYGED